MRALPSFLVAATSLFLATAVVGQEARPNFLVLVADDLGWADVGVHGPSDFYETPHLDRLAAMSLRTTRGYAAAPVCSPSRYALMTGKHPVRGAATEWFGGQRKERFQGATYTPRMEVEETTVAERLRDLGYATAFLGKWHLGDRPELWPEAQGFEVNVGGFSKGHPPSWFSPYKNPRLEDGPKGEHLTARLTEEAVRLLEQPRDRPFLLWMSYYQVHTPLAAPKPLVDHFQAKRNRLPKVEEFAEEEQVWPTDRPRRVRVHQNHATYAAMLASLDQSVGRLLDTLEAQGLLEDTVILFTSDNGGLSTSEGSPTSNLPLRGGKGWLYEGGLRVPFFLRVPGRTPEGAVTDAPMIGTDVPRTLVALAGGDERAMSEDGRSLVPRLDGSPWPLPRTLMWHYPHYANQGGFPGTVWMEGDQKLLLRLEDGRAQLHELEQDKGEQRDLAADHPERAAGMRSRLLQWMNASGAHWLRPLASTGAPHPYRPDQR